MSVKCRESTEWNAVTSCHDAQSSTKPVARCAMLGFPSRVPLFRWFIKSPQNVDLLSTHVHLHPTQQLRHSNASSFFCRSCLILYDVVHKRRTTSPSVIIPTNIACLWRDASYISWCHSCRCTKFPLDYSHNVFTFSTTPSLSPSTPKQSKKS